MEQDLNERTQKKREATYAKNNASAVTFFLIEGIVTRIPKIIFFKHNLTGILFHFNGNNNKICNNNKKFDVN